MLVFVHKIRFRASEQVYAAEKKHSFTVLFLYNRFFLVLQNYSNNCFTNHDYDKNIDYLKEVVRCS